MLHETPPRKPTPYNEKLDDRKLEFPPVVPKLFPRFNSVTQSVYPGEIFPNTNDFDDGIRVLLPRYEEMLDAIAYCIPTTCTTLIDLGCGTAELSLRLLKRCPEAQILAVDYSPRMVEFARAKVTGAGYGDRWHAVCADFGELARPSGNATVPNWGGIQSSQACVSSLAIHHLDDDTKQALFAWVANFLEPGGCFWNADPVLAETPALQEVYRAVRQTWADEQGDRINAARAKVGTSVPQGSSGPDRLATLEAHLEMLRTAGFSGVAVPWKYFGFAVFGGYA